MIRMIFLAATLCLVFAATAEAQQSYGQTGTQYQSPAAGAQGQPQGHWMPVRSAWFPGKNIARGFRGAFGYSVPPRWGYVYVMQPPATGP